MRDKSKASVHGAQTEFSVENVEDHDIDLFAGAKGPQRDSTESIELLLQLELPRLDGKGDEVVNFEMELPSIHEIQRLKRRKYNSGTRRDGTLSSEIKQGDIPKEFSLCVEEPEGLMFGESGKASHKEKSKGSLHKPIIAEIDLKPCDIRDMSKTEIEKLSEQQVKEMMTTNDHLKPKINVEKLNQTFDPPGIIYLEPTGDQRRVNRVSLSEDELKRRIMELFENVNDRWKVEEISKHLEHPSGPIKTVLK